MGDESKTNMRVIVGVILIALAIGGLALWFFLITPDEELKPDVIDSSGLEIRLKEPGEAIIIPHFDGLSSSGKVCLKEKIGNDFEKKILSGELSPERIQAIVDECSGIAQESPEFIPPLESSKSQARYQLASPHDTIDALKELFSGKK